jgi:hypothetical protein
MARPPRAGDSPSRLAYPSYGIAAIQSQHRPPINTFRLIAVRSLPPSVQGSENLRRGRFYRRPEGDIIIRVKQCRSVCLPPTLAAHTLVRT